MERKKRKRPTYEEEVFEVAFVEFWESKECNDLNWVLYDLIKAAFEAGYRAAGKEPPEDERTVRVSWKPVKKGK